MNPFRYDRDNDALPHVLSLGAGVQSSTLALMAAHGEVTPMPDFAIFADTGWEPAAVYRWLDWLEGQLPFPVVRVSKGNIRDEQIIARMRGKRGEDGSRWASLPYFTTSGDAVGMVRRQCTAEYKIQPIEQYLKREMLGLRYRQRAPKTPQLIQWRGISLDEPQRAKESLATWFDVRYPLLEARMTRGHCLEWVESHGYPLPPRSACLGCPFHSDDEWQRIKDGPASEWQSVVEFDRAIRQAGGMRGKTFLHRSLRPIDEIEFQTADNAGQTDLFAGECEGMCGL